MFIYTIIIALIFITISLLVMLIIGTFLNRDFSEKSINYFGNDFLELSQKYQRTSLIIYVIRQLVTFISMLVLFLVVRKVFANNYNTFILTAAAAVAIFFIALIVITFMFSYYRGFIVEHRYGLSNYTFNSWFADYLKSQGISFVINLAAFSGVYALMKYVPRYWWLISWSVLVIFIVIGTYITPIIIDPLFYKFRPLEDKILKEKVIEIAEKSEVKVSEVLVADASKKTKKANAYFTGFGKTKRIVIYDNLLNNFTREQTISVIAHEIGHWKYSHINKSIILVSSITFIGFLFFAFLIKKLDVYDIRGLFLIIILFSLLSFVIKPLENYVSRRFEIQADETAYTLTQDHQTQIDLIVDLSKSNLSMVEPNKIVRFILYTHPSAMERINNVLSLHNN